MFIAIIVIILGACVTIVWSMYFNTISLQKTYGTVNWYYWAYYGAMGSIERWLLMSKIKYPTYVWSGWFKWDNVYGAPSNWFSGEFWKLTQWNNSMTRSIDSSTDKIEWIIDTKTLRLISFSIYNDDDKDSFSWGRLSWRRWIEQGLYFTGNIEPWTYNLWPIPETKTWLWESTDFNRFFSLEDEGYVVRWLNTTDTYWQGNPDNQEETPLYDNEGAPIYDREWEKDFQLTWEFNFTGNACNPRPALSWQLNYDYYVCPQ